MSEKIFFKKNEKIKKNVKKQLTKANVFSIIIKLF